jgi:hypothetical protein
MDDFGIETAGSVEQNGAVGDNELKVKHINTLGSVQLRHPTTNDLIQVPTPSNDPNDPLNWYKYDTVSFPSILQSLLTCPQVEGFPHLYCNDFMRRDIHGTVPCCRSQCRHAGNRL